MAGPRGPRARQWPIARGSPLLGNRQAQECPHTTCKLTAPPTCPLPQVNSTSTHTLGTRFYEDDTFAVVDNALWAKYGGTYGAGLTKTKDNATVRHQRMVIAVKPAGAWVIADRLVPATKGAAGQLPGAQHEFRHPWLLPSSFGPGDIELSSRGFRTTLTNGTNVRVRHDRPARLELYYGGGNNSTPLRSEGSAAGAPVRNDLGPLGWAAAGIGSVAAAPNVHSVMTSRGPLTILTTVQAVPAKSQFAAPPRCSRSEVAVTCTVGRRQLRLNWVPDAESDGIYDSGTRVAPIPSDGPPLEAPDARR